MSNSLEKQEKVGVSKLDNADKTLGFTTKVVTIVGAAGTLFVWLTANFYTGQVRLVPSSHTQAITTRVSNEKGQEAYYHTNNFYLMPGKYHLEITPDNGEKQHANIEVAFLNNVDVPVKTADSTTETGGSKDDKHRWWQFWKD